MRVSLIIHNNTIRYRDFTKPSHSDIHFQKRFRAAFMRQILRKHLYWNKIQSNRRNMYYTL